jgi:hypothetical protein
VFKQHTKQAQFSCQPVSRSGVNKTVIWGDAMLQAKTLVRKSGLSASIVMCLFLAAHLQIANGAESGCITCHLDKEMLKKNITVTQGQKSTMQSGAG